MAVTETIIYQGHPDWLNFGGIMLIAGVILILALQSGSLSAAIFILVLSVMLASYGRFKRLYTVTNHRVIIRVGLIARNTNEMDIRHIRGINVRQNILERILGIGTIEIISAADGGAEVVFSGVRDPFSVKDSIRALRPAP